MLAQKRHLLYTGTLKIWNNQWIGVFLLFDTVNPIKFRVFGWRALLSLINLYYIWCVWIKHGVTHVCYTSFLSILMHRNRCWAPHTCPYSCTLVHIHLEYNYQHIRSPPICHSIFNRDLPMESSTNTFAFNYVRNQLTLLTPFSCVALKARAHVVPHTLTSILTRRTAYGWKTTIFNCDDGTVHPKTH